MTRKSNKNVPVVSANDNSSVISFLTSARQSLSQQMKCLDDVLSKLSSQQNVIDITPSSEPAIQAALPPAPPVISKPAKAANTPPAPPVLSNPTKNANTPPASPPAPISENKRGRKKSEEYFPTLANGLQQTVSTGDLQHFAKAFSSLGKLAPQIYTKWVATLSPKAQQTLEQVVNRLNGN